jgi:hypothetical protein
MLVLASVEPVVVISTSPLVVMVSRMEDVAVGGGGDGGRLVEEVAG